MIKTVLWFDSEVYGEEYDSEKHYIFSLEQTNQLFSIISFEDFLESCRAGGLLWMEMFLIKNNIQPKTRGY